ncbi:ABC transporter substrate-binding protein [uncultured Selenomonas sp.]|uniref:ABC transporter substrate-binding protein n=1 Tax=uncultured Selenomonas sp. TaxID=159275 RepID=UPI0025DAF75C|nr:ABC transporter substrate-binding protein [uncultured Selenomonas sp.]
MKRLVLGFLIGCLLLIFAGCGGAPQGASSSSASSSASSSFATINDAMGRTVVLDKKPERIVVTSASFLEPLHEVGGDVVGRPDSKTQMPDFAKDKASVGKVYQIDTEKVLACEPDLVIINKGMNEKLAPTLEESGIKTIVVDMKSYDDVKNMVGIFAQVTGEKEKGEALVKSMDEKIATVVDKMPKTKHRVAILHSTNQGLTVQLDGSIAGSVTKMLGWENVAANDTPLEKNPDAAPYSLETLVQQNPEIIFVTSMGKIEEIKSSMEQTIADNPAWQTIPAIQQKKLFYLPQDLFLLSPGIHYPEAVETMAKLVDPEAFK